ncbi:MULTISPECIES: hypothetical protein [unclassified Streptomyces]|uniref:hypothetical protein n=1 Tax=unclassified Streptomyces TaxID=2593676 RepID=UPI00278C0CB5|nr:MULTISPECIES: hypothetical protein [unclassified Streptomyces]
MNIEEAKRIASAACAEEMRPRVVALLPPGTPVTGPFTINRLDWWREREPVAPADRRPKAFVDADNTVGTGHKAKVVASTLFWGDENASTNGPKHICDDPGKREKYKRRKRGFWGGWDSPAGQLETAIQPNSRWWYVRSFLVLTPDALQVFYAPCASSDSFDLAEGAEAGWRCPRSQLAWIRRQKKETLFEFGFTDGSWATLNIPNHEFTTQVPGILPAGASRP